MADNVAITAGSGTNISTDQLASGEHVQFIKIMDGTLDGTTKAAVGANGLSVDVKASVIPTGASTAAKQPALGTAGAASADVLTIQGVASMTAVKVDGSGVTQPVSGTVTDNQGTAAATANAWPIKLTDGTTVAAVKAASVKPVPADPAVVVAISPNGSTADSVGTTISTANATVTLTLAAAGAGLFHYITALTITNINPTAAAIAGSAVTLSYTTTNLPGSLTFTAGNALAAGVEKVVASIDFSHPLKSSTANTATTVVAPAIGAGGLCRITAYYYIAA